MSFTPRKTALYIILIAAVVFVESCIPYICAIKNTPPGYQFSGQLAYSPDQNMYFSFISQARDGAFVLKNKLTTMPHSAVFVNLEYWLVGFIQRITGISENAVYHVWRFMGAVLLAIGFYMLVMVSLPSPRRRVAAFAAFFCTGGFGFIFAMLSALHLIGFDTTQQGIIDMRYGSLPFQQLITNPHFSFPHGLILIAYAFFMMGERYGKDRYYLYSGIMFNVIGLVRPYDIIPPVIIFPLYVLLTNGSLRFEFRMLLRKMLPLLLIVPVFLYNVWLFKYNEVFKYWSLQGHNAGTLPSVPWHYMVYGIVGVLALVRLMQAKQHRPGKMGVFIALWFGVTFVFIHLGRYFPAIGWSPQIGVYLAAPLTLAACSVQYAGIISARAMRFLVIPVIAGFILISNLSIMLYFSKGHTGPVKTPIFYTSNAEMEAMQWLRSHARTGEVVLADNASSQRIAKYTSASVVASHYSVTPRFAENAALAAQLLADSLKISGLEPMPENLHIRYVYLKPAKGATLPANGKYLTPVYGNTQVAIYKVQ